MSDVTIDNWIRIIQFLALVAGGMWALYIYGTARRGQARLGIEVSTRIKRDLAPGKSVLLARLIISNTSAVLWRNEESLATLFDARKTTDAGGLRLVPFAQADPFLPVYGLETEDPQAIDAGQPFSYFEDQEIMLEPGEQVVCELAFPLDTDEVGLMALKIRMTGRQRNRANTAYEWATVLFIDPDDGRYPSKMEATK